MRKLVLAVLAVVCLAAGSAFAVDGGVINLKAGLDTAGSISGGGDFSGSDDVKMGFTLAGEYLFKFNDVFRLGGGIAYQLPRETDTYDEAKISYMPIYITMELSPISAARGVYFKGNLGYNVLFDFDRTGYEDDAGGVYLGFGAGYAFNFGLLLEMMYDFHYGTASAGPYDGSISYGKFGLNVGYRINI